MSVTRPGRAFFWNSNKGTNLYATVGLMTEKREGGTRPGKTVPDGSPFAQDQDSERLDTGLIINGLLGNQLSWTLRGSAMLQTHNKRFGEVLEDARHESFLLESRLSLDTLSTQWAMAMALKSERFEVALFSEIDQAVQPYPVNFSRFPESVFVPGLKVLGR